MNINVKKWGNSLAIRIPKSVADQMHVSENTELEVKVEGGKMIVLKPKYSLDELMKKVDKSNLHAETDTGEITGNEIW